MLPFERAGFGRRDGIEHQHRQNLYISTVANFSDLNRGLQEAAPSKPSFAKLVLHAGDNQVASVTVLTCAVLVHILSGYRGFLRRRQRGVSVVAGGSQATNEQWLEGLVAAGAHRAPSS